MIPVDEAVVYDIESKSGLEF